MSADGKAILAVLRSATAKQRDPGLTRHDMEVLERLVALADAVLAWDKRYGEDTLGSTDMLVSGPEWAKWVELARGQK